MTQQIIIGCPGQWNDQDDIIRSIALANTSKDGPEYLAAGNIFFNAKTKQLRSPSTTSPTGVSSRMGPSSEVSLAACSGVRPSPKNDGNSISTAA